MNVGFTPNKGFNTFNNFKNYLGSAGNDNAWHHVVEQCQITKSGFSPQLIHNVNNMISIDSATHAKISGFYNSSPLFAEGMRVRDWLAGQSLEFQFQFGLDILNRYGVKK